MSTDLLSISNTLCNKFSFQDETKNIVIPISEAYRIFDYNLVIEKKFKGNNDVESIRLVNNGMNSVGASIVFKIIHKSKSDIFKAITKTLVKDCDIICQDEITKNWLKESIDLCDSILFMSCPNFQTNKCMIGAFALLRKDNFSNIIGNNRYSYERVGVIDVICAVDPKVIMPKENLQSGIGSLLIYLAGKFFYNEYNIFTMYLQSSSISLIYYYMQLGFHYGIQGAEMDENMEKLVKSIKLKDNDLSGLKLLRHIAHDKSLVNIYSEKIKAKMIEKAISKITDFIWSEGPLHFISLEGTSLDLIPDGMLEEYYDLKTEQEVIDLVDIEAKKIAKNICNVNDELFLCYMNLYIPETKDNDEEMMDALADSFSDINVNSKDVEGLEKCRQYALPRFLSFLRDVYGL